ncbi:MAG: TIGR02646 family protein [Phycisphaerae bacterium]|nr:TIGR02646 family protein [Phycisphaerae bacterium]
MRAIAKNTEPRELAHYRNYPNTTYDGDGFSPVKDIVREALLAEQGHLCAYCMQRINKDSIKIDHWHCQSKHSSKQLDYKNLLGCCMGNEGKSPKEQHCDTKKSDDDISFNPANPNDHRKMKIRYLGNGMIRSDNLQFNEELNSILNLNLSRLKSNRKTIWKSVTQVLSKTQVSCTRNQIEKLIVKYQKKDSNGYFKEYCDVAIYYLEKKLKGTR